MNLKNNLSWTALLHIANTLFPIVTLPLLLSILDLNSYGQFLIISSLVGVYIILVDFGTSVYALKLLSKRRENKKSYSNIYSQTIWIKVIAFLFLSIFFCMLCLYSDNDEYIFPTIILALSQSFTASLFYQSAENNKPLAIFTSLIKVCVIAPVLALVSFLGLNLGLNEVVSFYALSFFTITLFSFCGYSKNYTINKPKSKLINTLVRHSSGFFFSRVSVLSYTKVNTVIVGVLWGEEIAAFFGTAEKVYNAIRGVFAPVTNALYPYMSRTKNISLFKKICLYACLANIVIILTANLTIEYGKEFVPVLELASHYFYIFSIALLFTIPSILYGYPFLGALGYSKEVNLSTLYGSFIYYCFILLGFFIVGYQIEIVIYGIIATEIFVFIYRYKKVRGILKL
ncbi:oligosaccharide flippase family protein [Vibrio diabolicus]|uniref:oligosaccharide flippase family protein n=1 Tax=Vibrio diabolicus TaxID=50719 RepID=UPI003751D326